MWSWKAPNQAASWSPQRASPSLVANSHVPLPTPHLSSPVRGCPALRGLLSVARSQSSCALLEVSASLVSLQEEPALQWDCQGLC